MIKRAGAVLVAFLVLVGCGVAAAAQDTAAFELVGLGVLEADKTGDEALSEPMTRAEFAAIVTRALGLAAKDTKAFTDVPSGSLALWTSSGLRRTMTASQCWNPWEFFRATAMDCSVLRIRLQV